MDTITTPGLYGLRQLGVETTFIALGVFAVVALAVAYASNSVNFPGFGMSPYLQFIYANFLKPHKSKVGDGQQSALESFYSAQVGPNAFLWSTCQLSSVRPVSMIPPESAFYAAEKTCLLSLLPNSIPV
jgi:hypothetical protein